MRRMLVTLATAAVATLALAAAKPAKNPREAYPASWWTEIPRDQAASWEILPQDAAPGEVILSKRTELGIFSNFAETAFELDGERYPSLEGFWQMMKYPENAEDARATFPGLTWPHTRAAVSQMSGFDAKAAGDAGSTNMRTMGINWVTYRGEQMPYRVMERGAHYQVIVRAMKAKLAQNPAVRDLLLKTGDLVLKPDHRQEGEVSPAWKYFEIWTELRTELQATSH